MAVGSRRYRRMFVRSGCATVAAVAGGALVLVAVPAAPASAATTGPVATVTFTTTGEHPFTVPAGVTTIHVVAIGGKGGNGYAAPGGEGARAESDLRVTPGSTIYAEVGGDGAPATTAEFKTPAGGTDGGGIGGMWEDQDASGLIFPSISGAGGGGASDIQTCPVSVCYVVNLASPAIMLLAAGGGGAGGDSAGGAGGTPNGGNATVTEHQVGVGLGATNQHPGGNSWYGIDDVIGSIVGGAGAWFGGGGGGGGYYGGGGGIGGWEAPYYLAGGGGGGASYGPAGTTYSTTTAPPSVTITYASPVTVRIAPASRSSLTLDLLGGVEVIQATPTGSTSQQWMLVPQGGSLYQIVNRATGSCLTTDGQAGDALFVWACPASPQNLWQLPANFGATTNGSLIWNPAYNLYLDVYGGSIAPGGVIDAWPYNGGYANQYFLPTQV